MLMDQRTGLGPEIIGYKRIERCVAHWRSLYPETDGEETFAHEPDRLGNMRRDATMGVVLAQEQRINALERRLSHVTAVLRRLGVEA